MQNIDFWIRITSLYRSQTSPVVLCMQNSVISTRINILCGSQPSLTANLGTELQFSMGPIPHLCFFACKTATLGPELQVSMRPSLHLLF